MSNYMKDSTPDFHCPFCPQSRLTWNALMFHIGLSHPPDEDVSELLAQHKHGKAIPESAWNALMFHIGSSHPPDEDVSELLAQQEHDERVALRGKAMHEIARENEEYFVVMVLTEEWIDVLSANVN